jgi:CheY-like chemotaxis protein
VADDNADAATSLATLLKLSGHRVAIANDGHQAVEIVQRFQPDLVILDLGMPGLNGIEAARKIRALPCGRNVRLVALTGWGQEVDRQRTREAGFDWHLVKPVAPSQLAEVLRTCEALPP